MTDKSEQRVKYEAIRNKFYDGKVSSEIFLAAQSAYNDYCESMVYEDGKLVQSNEDAASDTFAILIIYKGTSMKNPFRNWTAEDYILAATVLWIILHEFAGL